MDFNIPFLTDITVPQACTCFIIDVGLVHMNGRVYDPHIGRFLSADPFIQQPDNVQSFNRYSYVLNNPLEYVEASGFFFKKLFRGIGNLFKGIVKLFKKAFKAILRSSFLRTVAAIGIAFLPGGSLAATFLKGFGTGFVASGGDLKSGIIGALTFGVSHVVGTHFGNLARAVGGALNTAQRVAKTLAHGGKFLSGFISAGTAQGFAQPGGYEATGVSASAGDYAYNAAASAVVGGTAAVLGGGKFKNGAITGAFAYTFGSIAQRNAVAADLGIDYETLEQFAADGGFSVGPDTSLAVNSLPQGAVDTVAGFGDAFGARYIRELLGVDGGINYDSITYQGSNLVGTFTPGLGTAATLKGAAALSGTRSFHFLNQNRYLRIGAGRIPKGKPFSYGPHPKAPTLRIGRGSPSPLNHHDLRVLGY